MELEERSIGKGTNYFHQLVGFITDRSFYRRTEPGIDARNKTGKICICLKDC